MYHFHKHKHLFHIIPTLIISAIFVFNYVQTFATYYYVGQIGTSGSGNGELFYPWKMTKDALGNIYVADAGNNRIQKFDSGGNYISQFGTAGSGDGEFFNPKGIAIDSDGYIYVADTDNNRIQKFDSSFVYVSQFGTFGSADGQMIQPVSIAIDSGNNLYVAEDGNPRIQKFDSAGNFVFKFGSYGSGDGEFGYVNDVYIKDSNLYVAEDLNDRVQKFDLNGSYISQFGTSGSGDGEFATPNSIAIDTNGDIIVSDTNNQRVQIFNSSGVYQTKFGSSGSDILQFANPTGLLVNGNDLYVVDNNNHRIQKLSLNLTVLTPNPPTNVVAIPSNGSAEISFNAPVFTGNSNITEYTIISNPDGIIATTTATSTTISGLTNGVDYTFTVKASNYLYTSASSTASSAIRVNKKYVFVLKFGTSGSGNGQFSGPVDIDVDSLGYIYVSEQDNNRVQKFDSNGNYVSQFGTFGTGDGQLDRPFGIKIHNNNIYVVDSGNARVQKFDLNGNFILKFGIPKGEDVGGNGKFYFPTFIDTDSQGNVYVADPEDTLIQKFDSNGNFISQLGQYGSADGEFMSPVSMAIDSQDNMYVVDSGNNRVEKFSSSSEYISQTGGYGGGYNQFYNMQNIELDNDNNIFISNTHSEQNIQAIKKYAPDYTFLTQIGTIQSDDDGKFNLPFGMAFDSNDDIYVVDRFNSRIQKFTLESDQAPTTPSAPQNVTAAAGNATATVSFTAPSSNGGSAILYYRITSTPGNIFATTTSTGSTTITGLTNGTEYTFVVNAINSIGTSATSSPSNAVTPTAPISSAPSTNLCPKGRLTSEDCLCPDGRPPTPVDSGTRVQEFTCERGGFLPVFIPPSGEVLPFDGEEILTYESWPPQNQELLKNNPKLKDILIQNSLFIKNYKFKKNLTLGSANKDVKALQMFLNIRGFILSGSGPGSIGNETIYFGNATRQALIKFQKANNIYPANGYFGPMTREFVNKILEIKN
jgi:sugar lactone lactonase YvrE